MNDVDFRDCTHFRGHSAAASLKECAGSARTPPPTEFPRSFGRGLIEGRRIMLLSPQITLFPRSFGRGLIEGHGTCFPIGKASGFPRSFGRGLIEGGYIATQWQAIPELPRSFGRGLIEGRAQCRGVNPHGYFRGHSAAASLKAVLNAVASIHMDISAVIRPRP